MAVSIETLVNSSMGRTEAEAITNQAIATVDDQKYTTLFVDGNHECFPRLNAYPEKEHNNRFKNVNIIETFKELNKAVHIGILFVRASKFLKK